MNFKRDVDEIMKNIQVGDEMTNNILNATTRKNRECRYIRKNIMAVIVAAVLCIGTFTFAIASDELVAFWNKITDTVSDDNFQVGEEDFLMEKGYIDVDNNVSDTYDGVEVTLMQTVADKYGMIIYLHIKSEEINFKKFKNGQNEFRLVNVILEDYGQITRSIGRIEPISKHEGVMEIETSLNNRDEMSFEGKRITVKLAELQRIYPKQKMLKEGKWELSWIGKNCTDSKVIELEHSKTQDGVVIPLKSIEITPLTININYMNQVYDEEGIGVNPQFVYTFVMKDGTKFKIDGYGFDLRGGTSMDSGCRWYFANALNIYNIDYVIVDDIKYDVK